MDAARPCPDRVCSAASGRWNWLNLRKVAQPELWSWCSADCSYCLNRNHCSVGRASRTTPDNSRGWLSPPGVLSPLRTCKMSDGEWRWTVPGTTFTCWIFRQSLAHEFEEVTHWSDYCNRHIERPRVPSNIDPRGLLTSAPRTALARVCHPTSGYIAKHRPRPAQLNFQPIGPCAKTT
ncbi:hypothetical protein L227DRAFT_54309 [Lentinus tigrinus ALCF2SS1-6]|uniref:Uncharacterized protein n=1 Tax=Lentinus tigrinus ALCF2SS1-6 TaxID=1328759 RepID=A0A5C2SJH4_9APHY|nr:hypothetical protein L227DRAFT_54309 [Lentinus tigrinus ALCF2SS1-6]